MRFVFLILVPVCKNNDFNCRCFLIAIAFALMLSCTLKINHEFIDKIKMEEFKLLGFELINIYI